MTGYFSPFRFRFPVWTAVENFRETMRNSLNSHEFPGILVPCLRESAVKPVMMTYLIIHYPVLLHTYDGNTP